ncbi:hypothetical protein EU514_13120 [Pseudomonas fragi]|nr:hypothetical protein [Pseudomonas fragi]
MAGQVIPDLETCGSGLAREGITAVIQTNRVACIASKPAPTTAAQTPHQIYRLPLGSSGNSRVAINPPSG